MVVLRLINEKLITRQALHGEFVGNDNQLKIDEADDDFPADERNIPLIPWDRVFDYYKVQPVTIDKVDASCRATQLLYRP